MLKARRLQIAAGILLLLVGAGALALFGARADARHGHHHVEARVSNVSGTVQISVGCEQAAEVPTGEARRVDLGWMPSDAQIFVSVSSFDRHSAWAFQIISNGEVIAEETRGHTRTLGSTTKTANAIVFARAYSAGGDEIGSVGCQEPGVVSRSDVPHYLRSPTERTAEAAEVEESSFQPRHSYDRIDALGSRSLPVLALLGVVAALLTPPIRHLAWSNKRALATGALAILGAGVLQLSALPAILTVAGTVLFFSVATFLVVGETRTRRWCPRLAGRGRGSRRS